ncbi:MAG: RAMP superfamily CRISPR-associated protein [Acidobacteriota bacterium]|nr:RAMP superfamily CRISPR-associated protein [Acidobacteriota bacterium]
MDRQEFRPRLHGSLERIALLDFLLTCRTGLHIGAGKSTDLAGSDQPVLRDATGRPLVPGSSLRGILRTGVEALCRAAGIDKTFADPGTATGGLLPEVAEILPHWRELDPVERLFGAAADGPGGFSYASRLQISDALCGTPIAVELRDGVGIERDSRTAATGIKFDLEVVPAGTRFRGVIRFKNPADFELGLLAQALWMLDSGALLLGGKSARGLGWVGVEIMAPRFIAPADILAGAPETPSDRTFGSVEEKLSDFLATLKRLVREAGASRQPAA